MGLVSKRNKGEGLVKASGLIHIMKSGMQCTCLGTLTRADLLSLVLFCEKSPRNTYLGLQISSCCCMRSACQLNVSKNFYGSFACRRQPRVAFDLFQNPNPSPNLHDTSCSDSRVGRGGPCLNPSPAANSTVWTALLTSQGLQQTNVF